MKMQIRNLALALFMAILALAVSARPSDAAERVALVIGNATYAHAPRLANPLNDAGDVGVALARLGFEVTVIENAGYDTLRRGLRAFTRSAATAEIAVVFYAGHGIEVDGRNFLVPVDARLESDREVEFETVPLDLVSRGVEGASGLGLVILDACRDNPFAASMRRSGATRSIGRGLARVEPSGETLVAYAAKEGTVAADGSGRNSPYTAALLDHVEEPGLEVGLMFRKVRDSVLAATGGAQEPFTYGSLSSEGVYLKDSPEDADGPPAVADVAGEGAQGATDGSVPAMQEQVAARAYEAAERLATVAAYEAFLRRFPESFYAELARGHIRELTGPDGSGPAVAVAADPAPADPLPEAAEAEVAALAVEQPADLPSSATPEEGEAALGLGRSGRRLVQESLTALGYSTRGVDGVIGPRSRDAIARWQAARGDGATGYLTGAQHAGLIAEASEAVAEARAEARARFAPGRKFRDCATCPEMVVIPGGTFTQGSPASEEGRFSAEGPQRRVSVRSFALGVTEVTFAQWDACVSSGGCSHRPIDWDWGRGSRPVIDVSWEDAKAYIAWLNRKVEGRPYRLPSESEWEYAARAGTQTRYSWGDGVGRNRANCDGCGSRWDGRVDGSGGVVFRPNRFGLHDMHGNVWEWVEDCWNGSYSGAPRDGSAWRSGNCSLAVLRGGSRFDRPDILRSANRSWLARVNRIFIIGFRVARTLPDR